MFFFCVFVYLKENLKIGLWVKNNNPFMEIEIVNFRFGGFFFNKSILNKLPLTNMLKIFGRVFHTQTHIPIWIYNTYLNWFLPEEIHYNNLFFRLTKSHSSKHFWYSKDDVVLCVIVCMYGKILCCGFFMLSFVKKKKEY